DGVALEAPVAEGAFACINGFAEIVDALPTHAPYQGECQVRVDHCSQVGNVLSFQLHDCEPEQFHGGFSVISQITAKAFAIGEPEVHEHTCTRRTRRRKNPSPL